MKDFCPIFLASQKNPDLCAFIFGEQRVSFAEANLMVGGVAKTLSFMGLGQRVSVVSNNSLEMIILIFALQRLGVSVVVHNTMLKPEDWKLQAELAEVESGFVAKEFREKSIFKNTFEIPELTSLVDGNPLVDFEKEAVIMFTSGSTGLGKGVRLSLRNFISNAEASNRVNDLHRGDAWLASLPLFHVGGLCIIFRTLLAQACSIVTNAKETFNYLNSVTHVSLVPSILEEILAREGGYEKLARLKNILLGGAPSSASLLEKIKKLNVRTSYGMTETCSHICMLNRVNSIEIEDLKTSGNLLSGVEAKLSEDGEISLKGPSIFIGYLGQKVRNVNDWFLTGDIGRIDQHQRLIIEGRKDRTIISGGENINPKQIEDLAYQCVGVKEVAVVGVDDAKWGKRPVVYVVAESNFILDNLRILFSEKLPKFKIPDKLLLIQSIPKTALGKIDYKELANKAKNLK